MRESRLPRPKRAKKRTGITLSIRLDLPDGAGHIGPGKIELLRRIAADRSIAAAARAMNMSYRRAWLLVDELNGLLVEPVVATWLGGPSRGGAELTPAGERLVATYEAVLLASARANGARLRALLRGTRPAARRSRLEK